MGIPPPIKIMNIAVLTGIVSCAGSVLLIVVLAGELERVGAWKLVIMDYETGRRVLLSRRPTQFGIFLLVHYGNQVTEL